MPSIMKDDKQQLALKEIGNDLTTLRDLNRVISSPDDFVIINFGHGSKNVKFRLDKNEVLRYIIPVLKRQQKQLVQSVRRKAAKYRIVLDKAEEMLLTASMDKSSEELDKDEVATEEADPVLTGPETVEKLNPAEDTDEIDSLKTSDSLEYAGDLFAIDE